MKYLLVELDDIKDSDSPTFKIAFIVGLITAVFSGILYGDQLYNISWINPLVAILLAIIGGIITGIIAALLVIPAIILIFLAVIVYIAFLIATSRPTPSKVQTFPHTHKTQTMNALISDSLNVKQLDTIQIKDTAQINDTTQSKSIETDSIITKKRIFSRLKDRIEQRRAERQSKQ